MRIVRSVLMLSGAGMALRPVVPRFAGAERRVAATIGKGSLALIVALSVSGCSPVLAYKVRADLWAWIKNPVKVSSAVINLRRLIAKNEDLKETFSEYCRIAITGERKLRDEVFNLVIYSVGHNTPAHIEEIEDEKETNIDQYTFDMANEYSGDNFDKIRNKHVNEEDTSKIYDIKVRISGSLYLGRTHCFSFYDYSGIIVISSIEDA
jgi:hypothetical protein